MKHNIFSHEMWKLSGYDTRPESSIKEQISVKIQITTKVNQYNNPIPKQECSAGNRHGKIHLLSVQSKYQ